MIEFLIVYAVALGCLFLMAILASIFVQGLEK